MNMLHNLYISKGIRNNSEDRSFRLQTPHEELAAIRITCLYIKWNECRKCLGR